MNISRHPGQIVLNSVPDHVEADAVVGVAQPIAEAANVRPGLFRQQRPCAVAETKCRFADPLQEAFDCVACLAVRLEHLAVQAKAVALDPFDVVEDVP